MPQSPEPITLAIALFCSNNLTPIIATMGLKTALEKNLFAEFCPKMVRSATKIAEEIITNKGDK